MVGVPLITVFTPVRTVQGFLRLLFVNIALLNTALFENKREVIAPVRRMSIIRYNMV
jgi:hypothetical protein